MFSKQRRRSSGLRKSEPVRRENDDGHVTTLIATDEGLAAVVIEADDANPAPAGTTDAPTEEPASEAATSTKTAPKARTPR